MEQVTTEREALEAAERKIAELSELLREAMHLGLSFDIGSSYIRRSYIDHQTELVARINAALVG